MKITASNGKIRARTMKFGSFEFAIPKEILLRDFTENSHVRKLAPLMSFGTFDFPILAPKASNVGESLIIFLKNFFIVFPLIFRFKFYILH